MKIAKIVSSNSHIDYVARVIDDLDVETPPKPGDYGFGQFVSMEFGEERIVGVIYDSRLVNPEYASYGPRLSPKPSLENFTPDFINEQGILLGIILLGSITGPGRGIEQGIPKRIIPAGHDVAGMSAAEVNEFHSLASGSAQLHYISNLMIHAGTLGVPLVKSIIFQLEKDCSDDDKQRFTVLEGSLAWKNTFSQIPL